MTYTEATREEIIREFKELRIKLDETKKVLDERNNDYAELQHELVETRKALDEARMHAQSISNRYECDRLANKMTRRDWYVLAVTVGALAGNSDAKIKDYPVDADALMAAVEHTPQAIMEPVLSEFVPWLRDHWTDGTPAYLAHAFLVERKNKL